MSAIISIRSRKSFALAFAFCAAGCGDRPAAGPDCIVERVDTLPAVLSEASGVAASRAYPGILWANRDGNAEGSMPDIVAIDTLGRLHGSIRIGSRGRDLEDIAVAPCGDRDCIYVADIGDNRSRRSSLRILRFPEPDPNVESFNAGPDVFAARFPDRAHDAEALFVLPGERVFVITKGRDGPVALYSYPGSLRSDTVTLRHVQDLTAGLVQFPEMVTGASADLAGRSVAVRTYSFVRMYTPGAGDSLLAVAESIPLAPIRESQGEGVAIAPSGTLFFVSERGFEDSAPPLGRMSCH